MPNRQIGNGEKEHVLSTSPKAELRGTHTHTLTEMEREG